MLLPLTPALMGDPFMLLLMVYLVFTLTLYLLPPRSR